MAGHTIKGAPRSATFRAALGKVRVVANVDSETETIDLEKVALASSIENVFAAEEVHLAIATD